MKTQGSASTTSVRPRRLGVNFLPLVLGAIGTILLLSVLDATTAVSATVEEKIPDIPRSVTSSLTVAPAKPYVEITKTIHPPNPDTGGIVTICFTIKRPWLDVVLAQDVSGSMAQDDVPVEGEGTETRLASSQEVVRLFADQLQDTDRAAVVPFSTTARLALPLTKTKGLITRTISNLTAQGLGNIGEGISVSHKELITSPRYMPDTIKAIILLSDGATNLPGDEQRAREYALTRARAAARDNIKIYTIGFGNDANAEILEVIADIGDGRYFFTPGSDVLETLYLTVALELRNLVITDVLTPGVETDCSQWPPGRCVSGTSGVTTVTIPISDSLLMSNPLTSCFTTTVNLDPDYTGPTNIPGSGVCYQDSGGQTICEAFDNPTITVGGRKITGDVFYDLNANGHRDTGEAGAPDVIVRTGTGLTTTTVVSGRYVLRISSEPTTSVIIEVPPGYVTTTPISREIPAANGIYTVDFGIYAAVYLPLVAKDYPFPSLINGSFEDGWTGWPHGGELSQAFTSTNPYSGTFSALLGDPTYKCEGGVPLGSAWIEQTIFIPHTVSPSLTIYYHIFTQDKNPYLSDVFDSFDVRVNGVLCFRDARRIGRYGCDPQVEESLGWKTEEIDLSDYRGENIMIRFENISRPDAWFNTWTFVDNIRVDP